VLELPSGNFLTISTEARFFQSYPSSTTDSQAPWEPAHIISDVLVEFRRDGSVVRQWNMFDLIDPYRVGYNSLATGFYANAYAEILEEPAPDLTHGNGLVYMAETDSVIFSLRHIDTLVKLNLGENRIEWILGDPTGWKAPWSNLLLHADGPIEWPHGQHAPELTPSGTLILFDNGSWGRAVPPNPQQPEEQNYSRAVEYEIDEAMQSVRQVWTYGDLEDDRFYTWFLGDTDWLSQTGNVLVTTGGQRVSDDGRRAFGEDGRGTVLITEVLHTEPPEKVWEIVIDDPAQDWTLYRAERMPSLYPQ